MSASTGRPDKTSDPPYIVIAPEVARLAAQGCSRNEIARQLKRAPSTVTRAAAHAGVEFTAGPADATKAAADRAAARRADLAELTSEIALSAAKRLKVEVEAPVLDPATTRALATAMGVSVDKALMLAATLPQYADDDNGLSAANAFMEAIHESTLEAAFAEQDQQAEAEAIGHHLKEIE